MWPWLVYLAGTLKVNQRPKHTSVYAGDLHLVVRVSTQVAGSDLSTYCAHNADVSVLSQPDALSRHVLLSSFSWEPPKGRPFDFNIVYLTIR